MVTARSARGSRSPWVEPLGCEDKKSRIARIVNIYNNRVFLARPVREVAYDELKKRASLTQERAG